MFIIYMCVCLLGSLIVILFDSLQGFDEFMNLVLDDAHEVNVKKGTRKSVGRILLKGDNITLIQAVSAPSS